MVFEQKTAYDLRPSLVDSVLCVRDRPILLNQSEFMRRYREMSALNGGLNFYGELPQAYNIIVNMENPLIQKVVEANDKESPLLRQLTDLALLSNGMLKGKALADFIARSQELLK